MSFRLLRQRPGFAAALLLTLALGIGAPTAIFSVVHAVLLRPLPYPEPDRIVRFRIESRGPAGSAGFDALPATTALEWGAHTATLAALGLFNDRALTLSTLDGPFRLTGVAATPNLFDLLGVAPPLGRALDATSTDPHQIVLSHATWQRFFAADPAIIGAPITLDGEPYRVDRRHAGGFQLPDAGGRVLGAAAPRAGWRTRHAAARRSRGCVRTPRSRRCWQKGARCSTTPATRAAR